MQDTSCRNPDDLPSSCYYIGIGSENNDHYAIKDKNGIDEALIPVGLHVVITLVIKLYQKENAEQYQHGNNEFQHPAGKIIFKLYGKKQAYERNMSNEISQYSNYRNMFLGGRRIKPSVLVAIAAILKEQYERKEMDGKVD